LGIGDDAAVLDWGRAGDCVVTVDLLTDGVDFELERVDPRRVGRKAIAVNLSDLAAMASQPVAAVVALALPRGCEPGRLPGEATSNSGPGCLPGEARAGSGLQLAEAIYEGMLPVAEEFGFPIAGGDTNTWEGKLVICITAIGRTSRRGPLCRSGARPGMRILVTGQFGGSILGHHFDFQPRVREALLLHERYDVAAAVDVSDGLSADLDKLATESGCGALLDLQRIPIAPAAAELARLRGDGVSPLEHALADGEDFELILAAGPDEASRILADAPLDIPITDIGQFVSEPGIWCYDEGERVAMKPRGFEH
jgi:thiamine-monophosphate kinase